MAHKNGLDGVYLTPTREQCFAEFKKAIPQLTVNDSARKQVELDQANHENSELEMKNKELLDYKTKVDQLWTEMERRESRDIKLSL